MLTLAAKYVVITACKAVIHMPIRLFINECAFEASSKAPPAALAVNRFSPSAIP